MSNYNRIVLMGRLGHDVSTRASQAGMNIANCSLAVTEKRKGEDSTMWVDVVCFDKTADIFAKYCAKGSLVLVEGRLQLNKWEDKDGNKRSKHEVVVDRLVLMPKDLMKLQADDTDYGTIPF
jgi:single-strand DNA-binding protein